MSDLRWVLVFVVASVAGCNEEGSETPDGTSVSGPSSSTSSAPDDDDATPLPLPRADLGVAPAEACVSYCSTMSECVGQGEGDCLLGCTAMHEERTAVAGTCASDHETVLLCVAGLNCDHLAAHLADESSGPCGEVFNEAELRCALGDDTPAEACLDLCTTVEACGLQTSDQCQASCSQALAVAADVGPACLTAQEALLACTSALTCDEYAAWANRSSAYPCQSPDEAAETACTGA